MPKSYPEDICILTKEDFFRSGETMHIQMSDEFPDYIGIRHKHEYIEIVYVVSGQAIHEIDGKVYHVKRGDLFIVNMNTPHMFQYEENSKQPFVAYDLMFTPEFFDSSISGYHPLDALHNSFMFHALFVDRKELPPFFSISGSEYVEFGDLFQKIFTEHTECKKGYREIIRAYLLQLIITIFRLSDATAKQTESPYTKQIVDFILNYIGENYASKISIKRLAETVYLHPDYLGRIFRDSTGTTITDAIQKVRIEHVCSLLSSTQKSIVDIARLCGFDDMKFFYSVFKKRMGLLPNEYRRSIRNDKTL